LPRRRGSATSCEFGDLVAKVPFFHDIGSSTIADVAGLLRPRDYPAGAVIMRRGDHGDCMYFVASGEVQIQLAPDAAQRCTLLSLDIVDFRELIGRQPDLASIIHEEAERRLVSADV
jgi:voltage-gated potassium channel